MKARLLLALGSPELARVVEHLVREVPAMEIVDRSSSIPALQRDAARLAPDVIVTSARLVGRGHGLQELRQFSPASKLVVITCDAECERDTRAADASLQEEDLVRQLLPILHAFIPAETHDNG
jgi:hypothetical protein